MPNFISSVVSSIAFIYSALPDSQTLHNGIEPGTEVITLDATGDGVEQITAALANRSGIKSIHIISHGRPASLLLGAIDLNLTNLKKYADQLQRWSAALAESAEILLYGCEVAAGDAGAKFVQQISLLTKAKIAASRSPVGSAAKGGDWDLDYTTGVVESELAIDPATMAAYQFVFGLQFLGQAGFPANETFGGTQVGGLSGLTYAGSNTYYAISDGRNIPFASPDPSRFYTLTIPTVSSGSLTPGQVVFTGVTQIGNPPSYPFAADTSDTEGIGFIGSNVFVSSEGNFSTNTQPFINSFAIATGIQNLALTIPTPKYDVSAATTSGIRNNQAFESLTITPSQSFLFTATENALEQDGPASDITTGARSRILRYNLATNTANGEFLYNTDPRNGISEMLAIDDNTLLVLERFLDLSTTPPSGDLKLYQISLNGATDIQTNTGLIASGLAGITPVSKTPIATAAYFSTTGTPPLIDNFEGMTFGPPQTTMTAVNGKRTLILVSDNNFAISTRFAAFAANNAPVLNNSGTPVLTAINEDVPSASNTGTLVSALIAGAVTDPDTADTQGIAVTATDNTNGSWEYSTNSGTTWTAFGTPSTAAARLLAGNASIRFLPNNDYNGSANITYQSWDGTTTNSSGTALTNGGTADISTASSIGGLAAFSTASETATITVNPVNDVPSFVKGPDRTVNHSAGAQTFAGWATAISPGPANESAQTVNFQVVANNPGLFSVPPAIDSLGQLTFTPATSATGTANITLNLRDSGGTANGGIDTSANQTFVINITNNPPIANPDTYNVLHDKVLLSNPSVLKNDTDADFDSLTTVLVTPPTKGTIFLDPLGNFTYTPNAGFFGLDTFTYSVSDGAATFPGTVNINVTNSLPQPQPDTYSISAGKALSVIVPGVLANDSDADSDTLTASLSANPTKGSIALNKDGSFTYTPNAGFAGTDTFTYTVSDGIVNSALATVTVNVNNNPPVAIADSYTTAFNTPLNVTGLGVLINDTDLENDPLTAILVAGPTKGAIALNANGSFGYTPNAGFAGTDSFTYKANDGKADSAIATATIIVNNPPTSPTPTSPTPTSPTPTSPTPTSPTPTSPTPTSPTPTSPTPTSPTPTSPTPTSPTPTSPTPTSPTPTSPTPTSPTPTSPTPTSPTPTSPTPTSPTPTSPTPTSPTPTSPTPTSPTPTSPTPTSPTPTSPTPTSPTPTSPTPTSPTPTSPTPTSPTPTATPTATPADRDCSCEEITLPAISSIPGPNSVDRTFNGTNGDDFLIGSNLNDAIDGVNGDDILIGGRGNDNIYGGFSSDVPIGPDTDNDLLSGGNGNDYLNGHAGNDLIFSGKGDDVAIGGKDDDLIWGDKGNDTLVGYQGNDCLFGGSFDPSNPDLTGRDLLFGEEGNDFLNGGDAADTLGGGEGDDTAYGGKGDDVLVGGNGDDLLLGDRGRDRICGGDGDDTIFGESAIALNGEPDSLCGGSGNDLMFGNGSFDQLCGGDGNDTVYGGKGDDSVAGSIGDDWLIGGLGNDTLQGGSGRDYFILTAGQGSDVITDFTKGEDVLILTKGLTVDQLSIIQQNSTTLIKIANTGQIMAVLNGVSAIGQQDFTII